MKTLSFKLSYHLTSLNFHGGNWVYKYPIRGGISCTLVGQAIEEETYKISWKINQDA